MVHRIWQAAAIAVLVSSSSIQAQAPGSVELGTSTATTPARMAALDALGAKLIDERKLVGLSFAVFDRGRLVHAAGYGWADREAKRRVTHETEFRWASISKPLTSVVAAMLAREKALDLDADIRGLVPTWPEKKQGVVTLRQLLSNQAGVGHYREMGLWPARVARYDSKKAWDANAAVAIVAPPKLLFEPGARYHYTTFGFMLAGAVVDAAGRKQHKKGYVDLVLERIAKPLGMSSLGPDYSDFVERPKRTRGYRGRSDRARLEPTSDVSWKLPGGGWISNVVDLARFGRGMLDEKFCDAKMRKLLWTPPAMSGGAKSRYGLGFQVSRRSGELVVEHGGSQQNTRTLLRMWPERGIAVAVMCNTAHAQPRFLGAQVFQAYVKGQGAKKAEAQDAAGGAAKRVPGSDEARLLARAKAIHERVLTLDTHKDISPLLARQDIPKEPKARKRFRERYDPTVRGTQQVDFPKMREGGLNCAFFIVYVGQGRLTPVGFKRAKDAALAKFEAIARMAKHYPQHIGLARSADDVERIWRSGRLVAAIGIENGYPMGQDLSLIERFHKLGARYMSITHNRHNQLGDSHTPEEPMHGGLTELGRKAVAEMNRVGIMVDVSHSSKKTMMDTVAHSKAPCIASHSSCHAVYAHGRNLDDEQLRALAKKGGVIQIVAFDTYLKPLKERAAAMRSLREELGLTRRGSGGLSAAEREQRWDQYRKRMKTIDAKYPRSTVEDLVDHVDHAVKVAGIDHVAISSDFDGGGGIKGWQDASETLNVTLALVRRGYTEEQIAKIWSGNTLRLWRDVEAVAKRLADR